VCVLARFGLCFRQCGAVLVLLASCCSRPSATLAPTAEPPDTRSEPGEIPTPSPGVAIVELFTSEGCSSCPAADAVVARIAATAERTGSPVFTIEQHVDYWDYLGWRDPFDDARFSDRQAGYRTLNRSTYTPQAVVNGVQEALGSDEPRLNKLIALALATATTTRLELLAEWSNASQLVHCQGDGAEPRQTLNLFVLETRAESNVKRGENSGEHLQHRNVARAFDARQISAGHFQATWQTGLPSGLSRAGVSVLAFTERRPQLGITGASLTVPK
jgi:hypothetical protein